MKLISFNVNGIRAIMKKDFIADIKKVDPDVLCLQETKAHPDQVDSLLTEYEHHFWNTAEKKGYSGTAVFSKIKPHSVQYGIGIEEHDKEGRVITVEYDSFYLINVYTPNAKRELLRLAYRQEWDTVFLAYMKKLEQNKPVIVCGDLNVAHKEIDLKHPKTNRFNPGFTDEERAGMDAYIRSGYIDTFRHFHSDTIKYSWWSYMFSARSKNVGWRIDYFLASEKLKESLKNADILNDIMGSDHCPVMLELK